MGNVSLPVLGPDPFTVNASVLNGKVDPLATEFNGNIENVNIASGAAIAASKLNLSTIAQDIAMSSSQILWAKGADVASGTSIALGTDGNVFDITGTTTIQTITAKQAGSLVILHFDGALTLTDDTGNLELQGSDITVAAEDEVMLKSDGTNWHRVASSVLGLPSGTANQFLQLVSGTTTQWNNAPITLDVVTADATFLASSTSEEDIISFSVPANTLGTNGVLRYSMWATWLNNSGGAATNTLKLIYGSTTLVTAPVINAGPDATAFDVKIEVLLKGDGATNSQEGWLRWTFPNATLGGIQTTLLTASNIGTAAEDSTGALNFKISGTSSVSSASIAFVRKSSILEHLPAV